MAESASALEGRHLPVVTATIIAAVVATGVRYHLFSHELPLRVAYQSGFSGRGLLNGRFDTLLTSQLLTRNVFMLVSIVASMVVMLGTYEVLAGSKRAAIVAIAGGITGPTLVTLGLATASGAHNDFATRTLSTLDYGASAITACAGGALVVMLGRRWLRWAAVAFVMCGLVLHHQFADWEHVVAFSVGTGIATFGGWARPAPRRRPLVAGGIVAGLMILGVIAAGGVLSGSSRGVHLVETRYPTPSTGGDRRVMVVLPANYDETRADYPVVELLHGRPGKPDDLFLNVDLLGIMAKSPPFIAVIPDGHGPVQENGDFADSSNQRLGAAVSDDLQAWVDSTYRTNGTWDVTGLSAGGYGASYLAERSPHEYDRACPVGGYFTARDPAFAGESADMRRGASPVLHASPNGASTMIVVGEDDAEGMIEARTYDKALDEAGQSHQLTVVRGAHDATTWDNGIRTCLAFLLDD